MPRGLSTVPEGGSGGGGPFIPRVKLLDDKEACVIRFLTDHDDIFYEWFHRVMEGGQFRGFKVCQSSAFGQACQLCDNGGRATTQFLAWVYEIFHDHPKPPPGRAAKQLTVGGRSVFRETVNAPRLMQYSTMHKGALVVRAERVGGSLLGHEFEWIRAGAAGSTKPTYLLEVFGESPMPSELKRLAAELPDLEDVAFERVTALDGGQPAARAPTQRVSAAAVGDQPGDAFQRMLDDESRQETEEDAPF